MVWCRFKPKERLKGNSDSRYVQGNRALMKASVAYASAEFSYEVSARVTAFSTSGIASLGGIPSEPNEPKIK